MEEDPKEILQSVYECMERTCEKLTQLNIDISNIKGLQILNAVSTERLSRVTSSVHFCLMLFSNRSDQPKGNHTGLGQGDGGAALQRNR